MKRIQTAAPHGGGKANVWLDGKEFTAAIAVTSSGERLFAGQIAGTQYYSIYVNKDMELLHDDYFRSEQDGKFMRVASMSREPPAMSALNTRLMYGEYVEKLPD